MEIHAVRHVRKMRGGSQSHLLLASDENFYVVKFLDNTQHPRILANEWIATSIAKAIGFAVPPCTVISVSKQLIDESPGLRKETATGTHKYLPGRHFASRFVAGTFPGKLIEVLPDDLLATVQNVDQFAGMIAFDKWTGNVDGRQAIFLKGHREKSFAATFIDQGHCFGGGMWRFRDSPLQGTYRRLQVYKHVTGWGNFEPWITRVESLSEEKIWEIARSTPAEWYTGDAAALTRLIEKLIERQCMAQESVLAFRHSSDNPFPRWNHRYKPHPRPIKLAKEPERPLLKLGNI